MNPNEIQDLVELLIEIGGSVAQAGFEVAHKYAIFQGASGIAWSVLCIVLGIPFVKYAFKNFDEHEDTSIVLGVVGGAMLLFLPFLLHDAVAHLIIPEWYAIQNLLGLIGGG